MSKVFKISKEPIRSLAEGHGACLATDMIMVEGKKVAFMYREEPDHDKDSGWRFMAGFESADYMNNAENHGVYDCNTIANYDPEIIPFLKEPSGTAFKRKDGVGAFEKVDSGSA